MCFTTITYGRIDLNKGKLLILARLCTGYTLYDLNSFLNSLQATVWQDSINVGTASLLCADFTMKACSLCEATSMTKN